MCVCLHIKKKPVPLVPSKRKITHTHTSIKRTLHKITLSVAKNGNILYHKMYIITQKVQERSENYK